MKTLLLIAEDEGKAITSYNAECLKTTVQTVKNWLFKAEKELEIQESLSDKDSVDYQAIYDKVYSAGYHEDPDYSHSKHLCDKIDELCEFESVLDIGCSKGWVLRRFEHKFRIAGVDASQVAVDAANELLWRSYRVARQGYAHSLTFPENTFDVVISTDCFEHIHPDHVQKAIAEAYRVSKRYIAMKICPNVDRATWKDLVGHDLHLTIQPLEWWKEQFLKHGGQIIYEEDEEFIIDLQ